MSYDQTCQLHGIMSPSPGSRAFHHPSSCTWDPAHCISKSRKHGNPKLPPIKTPKFNELIPKMMGRMEHVSLASNMAILSHVC